MKDETIKMIAKKGDMTTVTTGGRDGGPYAYSTRDTGWFFPRWIGVRFWMRKDEPMIGLDIGESLPRDGFRIGASLTLEDAKAVYKNLGDRISELEALIKIGDDTDGKDA